jgi:uncharacterized protein RhaS with RHS repeats
MSARNDTLALQATIARRGVSLSFEDANTLRRAQITLHGWNEQECGDSNDYASWSIERDEAPGKPYRVTYSHSENKSRRYAVPDRETGALRRVRDICQRNGLHYWHQTDPRGCALYVDVQPLNDNDYSRGIACSL